MKSPCPLQLFIFAAGALTTGACQRGTGLHPPAPTATTTLPSTVDAAGASADARSASAREAGVAEGGADSEACKAFAETVCRLGKRMSHGRSYRCPIVGIPWSRVAMLDERCRAGNEILAGVEVMPPEMQAAIGSQVIVEVIGTQKLLEPTRDATRLLSSIDFELKRRRSPDAYADELRAVGPLACLTLVDRYRTATGRLRRIVHQLLVDLQGGDLGARPDAWREWCGGIVLGSVDLTLPGPSRPSPSAHWRTPPPLYYEDSRWRIPASERRRDKAHAAR